MPGSSNSSKRNDRPEPKQEAEYCYRSIHHVAVLRTTGNNVPVPVRGLARDISVIAGANHHTLPPA